MMELYKKNKALIIFLLRAAGIYLFWYIIYNGWIYKNGVIDNLLIEHLISATAIALKVMGFTIFTEGRLIGIVDSTGLIVNQPCDGLSLFALFAGFIIAYPGKLRSKFIFIPIGLLIIDLVNIVRIIALVIIVKYTPQSLEFNHSYTFTFIMYVIIFLMWVGWIKKQSPSPALPEGRGK